MKNKPLVISLIFLLIIVVGIIVYFGNKKTVNNTDDNKNNVEQKEEKQDYIKNKKYYQDSVGVGSNFTGIYYFEDNNVYYLNDMGAIKEKQELAFVGTWQIKNNKLIINVTKKFSTKDGKIKKDAVLGETLVDYSVKSQEITEVRAFELEKVKEDGKEYISGDIILYEVNIDEDDILDKFSNLKKGKYEN